MKTINKGADLSTAIDEVMISIAEKSFKWDRSHISGKQLREHGNIPDDAELLVVIREEEEHILLDHDHWIDVVSEEIELIYFRRPDEKLVIIEVNEKKFAVKPGKYTVPQIKQIGKVPLAYELEEVISGKLTLLGDNDPVEIKGCEVFFGHVKDGSSS